MMTKKKEEAGKTGKTVHTHGSQKDSKVKAGDNAVHEEPAAELEDAGEKVKQLEDQVAKLNASLASANNEYLLLRADFDNFRKRSLKEKMDLLKTAAENVMVGILPVIDDLERAMDAMYKTEDLQATRDGITLIYNKFKDFTRQNGVTETEAVGLDLDTDRHEAIARIPAPSDELKGKIVEVAQKGYLLNDKVIRYAKVVMGE